MKQKYLSFLVVIVMFSIIGTSFGVPVQARDFKSKEIEKYQKEQEKKLFNQTQTQIQKAKSVNMAPPASVITITNVTLDYADVNESNVSPQMGAMFGSGFKSLWGSSYLLFFMISLALIVSVSFGLRSMFRRVIFVA